MLGISPEKERKYYPTSLIKLCVPRCFLMLLKSNIHFDSKRATETSTKFTMILSNEMYFWMMTNNHLANSTILFSYYDFRAPSSCTRRVHYVWSSWYTCFPFLVNRVIECFPALMHTNRSSEFWEYMLKCVKARKHIYIHTKWIDLIRLIRFIKFLALFSCVQA